MFEIASPWLLAGRLFAMTRRVVGYGMPGAEQGLTTNEAKKRLEKYGLNALPEKKPPSDLQIFLSQLKSPLVYVLIFAGIVTLLLGHFNDSVVIGFAILLNTILGFFQERRAENALYALKKFIQDKATVIRNGERLELEVSQIVPGDICILNEGEKVPADGKLVFANRLFIGEAILTGESVPVEKKEDEKVYMGTIITAGQGTLLAEKTGASTEIGKIAKDIQDKKETTPLERQLIQFSRQLTFVVLFLTLFVFVSGILVGRDFIEIFTTSVALAVAAIPEGLLVGLTVVLAIGMQRILAKKGLVRNLVSAETLGGVTTICLDKTGTLTEGVMQVVDIIGDKKKIAVQSILANDRDDPMVHALWDWGLKNIPNEYLNGKSIENFLKENERIDSIPFSSKERHSVVAVNLKGEKVLFVNGAPEYVLEWTDLKEREKKKIKKEIDRLTAEGKRLIGMARKNISSRVSEIDPVKSKKKLEWVGIIALSDPIRVGTKEALNSARKSGVKLIIITGDYAQTARFVLSELGFVVPEERIILGHELSDITDNELGDKLGKLLKNKEDLILFARTSPEQKLKIVSALKKNKEVIAMLGDGVNDAPALKTADIGVVVGSASDVAKESSDLVLLDSQFSTVVSAIEEGRGIFNNLRKIILYLMSGAFAEITAVVLSIFFGLPLPIAASQILWINLVSDGFPHLALSVDPKESGVMKLGPRPYGEPLIANWMKKIILLVSISGGIVGLGLFWYYYNLTQNLALSQSIAFAALGTNTLIYVFSIRALEKPIWSTNIFENKWLNVAVVGGFLLQVLPFLFESTRNFLGLENLYLHHWILVIASSFLMLLIIEVLKVLFIKNRLTISD